MFIHGLKIAGARPIVAGDYVGKIISTEVSTGKSKEYAV